MDKLSYALGIGIGSQLRDLGATELNATDFAQAVADMIAGREPAVDQHEAQQLVNEFIQTAETRKQQEMAAKGKVHKEAGEKFLAENAKKAGIVTLPSGLQYEVLNEGTGRKPKATDQVRCHYEGTLIDGTVFDSSYKRNQPATFACNQVIKGWTEALTMMPVGSKWELYIPQELAYGDRESGKIPPFSMLIFTVELLEIVK